MGKPELPEMFKVTEREAGTGRIAYPVRAASASLEDASASSGLAGDVYAGEGPHSEGGQAVLVAETSAAALERAQEQALRGICGNEHIMGVVEDIRRHPLYVRAMKRLELAESDRQFCLHQTGHLLDVARIAYIRVLERKMPFRKEVVYAAALLHDIGKAEQYENGEPHERAGARIATEILSDIQGLSALEKTAIVAAVAQHRKYREESSPLGKLLFEADKASRPCFACPVRANCSWSEEKKNQGVKV